MLIENKKIVILSVSAGVALVALGALSARLLSAPVTPAHAPAHPHAAQVEASEDSHDEQAEELTEVDSHAEAHAPKHEASHKSGHKDSHENSHEERAPAATHIDHAEHSQGFISRILHTYGQAFISIQQKVDELKRAEEENVRLRIENAHYRVQAEQFALGCKMDKARALAEEAGEGELHLSAIEYRAPEHLLPEQRFALAVSYFKGREDEKAVINFNLLADNPEDTTYKTAQIYLMLGVSWYRLDNHKLADQYFTRALKAPATRSGKYHAQARLWRAMVAQQNKKSDVAQSHLKDLIAHHPHSTEAAWVNPKEGGRMPASKPARKHAPAKSHGHH